MSARLAHPSRRRGGVTLIELILVMALLSIVVGLSLPTLSHLFRGRMLGEEARRILALTRHARSQAVSLGVPIVVWFDPAGGEYGLSPGSGYAVADLEGVEFTLADGLDFEIDEALLGELDRGRMRFLPDGSIDEASIKQLVIAGPEGRGLRVRLASQMVGYTVERVEVERP